MKTSNGKQLAKKMLIAMICGLACGFGCIMLREHLVSSGQTDLWTKINNLFFQDITQPTATKAVGIFYIVGQLFVNSLQLIIVPMVFVSITLAISTITDTKKLFEEVSKIITLFLSFVVNKFAPIGIFCLLTRTFAIYGIDSLRPALAYVVTVVIALFVYLFLAYPVYLMSMARVNPKPFMKKMVKVALFGFSTSSSAATLPINKRTVTEELGVDDQIASFVLPLGMTINMDGTAIMQVIAAMFIAASSGYKVTFMSMAVIAVLALIASVGTPAAPGAGAVILFTILTGMGYTNDAALLAYSLILSINRPIEMLVTSLNVVGDASTSVIVAKKENMIDQEVYKG